MPVTPTYPGVYIEEVPSGVRTITGVATSITAFIGRALRGLVNEPMTINSFADYERRFGGLWVESTMSFAVRDFFLNGGSKAIIVRLYRGPDAGSSKAVLTLKDEDDADLTLEAAYPGSWGDLLRVRVDHDVNQTIADKYGVAITDLFNLMVCDTGTGVIEEFRNVTLIESPRKLDKVLENESKLVRATALSPKIPVKHAEPTINAWEEDAASTKVENGDEGSDGKALDSQDFTGTGMKGAKEGLYSLEKADLFNLLCIPPFTATTDISTSLVSAAATYCEKRRAMLIVDAPSAWNDKDDAVTGIKAGVGTNSRNSAIFFPRLRQPNPLRDNQTEDFAACGAVAGVFARTDASRGVWKAPAGQDATLVGVPQLSVSLTNAENGELNPLGVNCLRAFPITGRVIWGARTLRGADQLADEYKYISVRRTALFIEESLYRSTKWVVFEPNDEPLWAQIRLNITAFMHNLFRQGAFQGTTPREAYLVKCDKETTTQNDINQGIVNILVGFAPLKPAEFVFIKIQQLAGQLKA